MHSRFHGNNLKAYLRPSRRILAHAAVVVSCVSYFVLSTGCSYFFGPKAEENKAFVENQEAACLKNVGVALKTWINGNGGDIGADVDCGLQAINDFTSHVEGQNKSLYTSSELANFIETYLAPVDSTLAGNSVDWTHQVLNLKQILFGGSADSITRAEVARLKSLLSRARPLLIDVTPYIRTLLFKETEATESKINSSRFALLKISDLLSSEIDRGGLGRPDWTIDELVSCVHRLGLEDAGVESWLPLVKVTKGILLGGDQEHVTSKDWSPMIRLAAKAWALAVQTNYQILGNEQWLKGNFKSTEFVMRETFALLANGVRANGGRIESRRLEDLIDVLAAKQLLPKTLTAATTKSLLPVILEKFLYGRSNSDFQLRANALGEEQLNRLRLLMDDWIDGQKMVNRTYASQAALPVNSVGPGLLSFQVTKADFPNSADFDLALRAQKQLLSFFELGRPQVFDSEDRVVVLNKLELPDVKKSDFDRMNMFRVLVSAVLQGWSTSPRNAAGLVGLTDSETQDFYLDVKSLGRDLGWIDVRNTEAGLRTFMENAIFMSSSNGDDYLNLQEGVEWFSLALSGSSIADRMYAEMLPECGAGILDVLGFQRLDIQCFRKRFLASWDSHLPNLPHMVSWVKEDGTGERARRLLRLLEAAARNKGLNESALDSSEFRSMIAVLQYAEGMFARFDQNKNQILDNDEIWNAFPLFAPLIKKLAKGKADSVALQKTVLSYLLETGDLPQEGFFNTGKLIGWHLIHRFFSVSADRLGILNVIGSFGKADRMDREKRIQEFYKLNEKTLRAVFLAGGTSATSGASVLAELFQCQDEAVPVLSDLLNKKADALAPASGPLKVEDFTTRMKLMIEREPRVEKYCLPF